MSKQKRILTEAEKIQIQKCKNELNEYRENIRYIEEKLNDTEEIRSKVEKVTTILSPIKTNASRESPDKFADAISRLEDLKIDCSKKMEELLIKKFIIDEKIEKVGQPYKNVLFYRYTRGKSWRSVADELGYKEDYIYDLHGEALYLYSKI